MENWSEHKSPNTVSHYDHVTWSTPLGTFIIEWKSWKGSPDFGIELNGEYVGTEYDLNTAKSKALEFLVNKHKQLSEFLGQIALRLTRRLTQLKNKSMKATNLGIW